MPVSAPVAVIPPMKSRRSRSVPIATPITCPALFFAISAGERWRKWSRLFLVSSQGLLPQDVLARHYFYVIAINPQKTGDRGQKSEWWWSAACTRVVSKVPVRRTARETIPGSPPACECRWEVAVPWILVCWAMVNLHYGVGDRWRLPRLAGNHILFLTCVRKPRNNGFRNRVPGRSGSVRSLA